MYPRSMLNVRKNTKSGMTSILMVVVISVAVIMAIGASLMSNTLGFKFTNNDLDQQNSQQQTTWVAKSYLSSVSLLLAQELGSQRYTETEYSEKYAYLLTQLLSKSDDASPIKLGSQVHVSSNKFDSLLNPQNQLWALQFPIFNTFSPLKTIFSIGEIGLAHADQSNGATQSDVYTLRTPAAQQNFMKMGCTENAWGPVVVKHLQTSFNDSSTDSYNVRCFLVTKTINDVDRLTQIMVDAQSVSGGGRSRMFASNISTPIVYVPAGQPIPPNPVGCSSDNATADDLANCPNKNPVYPDPELDPAAKLELIDKMTDLTLANMDAVDWGVVAAGSTPVVRTFRVRNAGSLPLNFKNSPRVTVPAGFTLVSDISVATLNKQEYAEFSVSMNTDGSKCAGYASIDTKNPTASFSVLLEGKVKTTTPIVIPPTTKVIDNPFGGSVTTSGSGQIVAELYDAIKIMNTTTHKPADDGKFTVDKMIAPANLVPNVQLRFPNFFVPAQQFTNGFCSNPSDSSTCLVNTAGQKLTEYFGIWAHSNFKLDPLTDRNPDGSPAYGLYQIGVLTDDGIQVFVGSSLTKVLGDQDMAIDVPATPVDSAISFDELPIEGAHPPEFDCASQTINITSATTRIPFELKYYQGPKTGLALELLWRKVSPSDNLYPKLCTKKVQIASGSGVINSGKFVDDNGQPFGRLASVQDPTKWKVLTPDNFEATAAAVPSPAPTPVPNEITDPYPAEVSSGRGNGGIKIWGYPATAAASGNPMNYFINASRRDTNPYLYQTLDLAPQGQSNGFCDGGSSNCIQQDSSGTKAVNYYGIEAFGRIQLDPSSDLNPDGTLATGKYQVALLADDGARMFMGTNGNQVIGDHDMALEKSLDLANGINYADGFGFQGFEQTHPAVFDCASQTIDMSSASNSVPYLLDYYQGAASNIALQMVWRRVTDESPTFTGLYPKECIHKDYYTGTEGLYDGKSGHPNARQPTDKLPDRWKLLTKGNFSLSPPPSSLPTDTIICTY